MRKFYRTRRNRVVQLLEGCAFADRLTILELDAGLHFLLRIDTELTDGALTALCEEAGIRIRSLGEYYTGPIPGWAEHCFVVNYSGLQEENLPSALERLARALENVPELWYDVR